MAKQFTPEDFGPITLSAGAHAGPWEGMCVMEMASFLSGESWTDTPTCSSPAISRFAQVGNDRMDQETRDRLQLYVPKLIGTASLEHERERAEYLAWQAIRVFAPLALDAVNLGATAERLRNFHGSLNDAACAADDAAADAVRTVDSAYNAYNACAASAACAVDPANAADAANAAAYAASFNAKAGWDDYFAALDGVIAIGPHGESYQPEHMARAPALKKALAAA